MTALAGPCRSRQERQRDEEGGGCGQCFERHHGKPPMPSFNARILPLAPNDFAGVFTGSCRKRPSRQARLRRLEDVRKRTGLRWYHPTMSLPHRLVRCLPAVLLLSTSVTAQQRAALTAADYARAEKFMPYNTTPLVL